MPVSMTIRFKSITAAISNAPFELFSSKKFQGNFTANMQQ